MGPRPEPQARATLRLNSANPCNPESHLNSSARSKLLAAKKRRPTTFSARAAHTERHPPRSQAIGTPGTTPQPATEARSAVDKSFQTGFSVGLYHASGGPLITLPISIRDVVLAATARSSTTSSTAPWKTKGRPSWLSPPPSWLSPGWLSR